MSIHYAIAPADPHGHHFHITLTVAEPAAAQTLSLPVWIPGSYLVREFARHLHSLEATQNGQSVAVQALNKNTWRIACASGSPLQLRYRVYAFDNSVRTAWLDDTRGFFNPTSLCLRVHGQENQPHQLHLSAPEHTPHWRVATALPAQNIDAHGFGDYQAADYDELADSPVEMGHFWQGQCDVLGIPHTFVVAGAAPSFDGQRLLADTRAICEAAMRLWHPEITDDARGIAPHDRYVFMLNAVGNGYGGLEHRHSTALICKRTDLPTHSERGKAPGEAYRMLLGLISHEYFHTWNVKRLRPAEFARYDYEQENYTRLLWFFEGFTSYYDDLLLRRAGLIDEASYLQLLGKTWQQVRQTPGRAVQSVAEASFDAWTKYYRQDENTANTTVSYYTKGALVALCLDLSLRQHGRATLDDLIRQLWRSSAGGPISEADILAALQHISGRDWSAEIAAWVHSTHELPVAEKLTQAGIQIEHKPATWAQRLGLQAQHSPATTDHSGGLIVRRVHTGSPAEQAGIAVGDEWVGVRLNSSAESGETVKTTESAKTESAGSAQSAQSTGSARSSGSVGSAESKANTLWRLHKPEQLDALLPHPAAAQTIDILLARDGRLLWRPLAIPAQQEEGEVQLRLGEQTPLAGWLEQA